MADFTSSGKSKLNFSVVVFIRVLLKGRKSNRSEPRVPVMPMFITYEGREPGSIFE